MYSSLSASIAEITVLDYESTGSVRGFDNEPWQIGMVSLRGGRIDSETCFESLLRVASDRPFNPHAPGRHGALREAIAAAPTVHQIWPTIMPRLTACPLCAHNTATEKKFIRSMAPMHAFGPWVDTLKLARKAWPGCPSYALEDLVVMLDLLPRIEQICPDRAPHDALFDAVASAALLEHLFTQPGWGTLKVGELASM